MGLWVYGDLWNWGIRVWVDEGCFEWSLRIAE